MTDEPREFWVGTCIQPLGWRAYHWFLKKLVYRHLSRIDTSKEMNGLVLPHFVWNEKPCPVDLAVLGCEMPDNLTVRIAFASPQSFLNRLKLTYRHFDLRLGLFHHHTWQQ